MAAAAIEYAAHAIGSILGLSVLPTDTIIDKKGTGFEPPASWLLDNPLYRYSISTALLLG